MVTYKVVPGPVSVQGSAVMGALNAGTSQELGKAASAFQAIIESEAQQGWEFVCFDDTTVHNACLWCLSKTTTDIKLLVFKRS